MEALTTSKLANLRLRGKQIERVEVDEWLVPRIYFTDGTMLRPTVKGNGSDYGFTLWGEKGR